MVVAESGRAAEMRDRIVLALTQKTVAASPASPPPASPRPAAAVDQDFLHSARLGDAAAIRRRVAAGAAIDAQDHRGYTALTWACHNGKSEAVAALLELRASTALTDSRGKTPLMYAAGPSREGRIDMVQALLAAGAQVDARDDCGRTALMDIGGPGGGSIVTKLVAAGADPAAKDAMGRTALHYLAEAGAAEAVLDSGAAIEARDDAGDTALLVVAPRSYGVPDYTGDGTTDGGRNEAHQLDVVRVLVRRGADVNVRDAAGRTPLARAKAAGNSHIPTFLRESGPR